MTIYACPAWLIKLESPLLTCSLTAFPRTNSTLPRSGIVLYYGIPRIRISAKATLKHATLDDMRIPAGDELPQQPRKLQGRRSFYESVGGKVVSIINARVNQWMQSGQLTGPD
jgi:hypothetical protein